MVTVLEAERDARQLLEKSGWLAKGASVALPVNPFELARGLGLQVVLASLPPDESVRLTVSEVAGVTVVVNVGDRVERQRFACAHALGHYVQSCRQDRAGLLPSRVDTRADLAGLSGRLEEVYANQFAAALLMPAEEVQRQYVVLQRTVQQLSHILVTSPEAVEVRLRNLRLA